MESEVQMANPKLGEGVTATAEAGGRHVRLKVEYTQTGWMAQVFETDGNTVVEREPANDLDVERSALKKSQRAILPMPTSRCLRFNGKKYGKSRVAPTLPFMSATVKKPGQAKDRTRGQGCCACCRSAYMKNNVCATPIPQP